MAEYCAMYLGNKPGMSTFVAEFLKRKAADPDKLRRQKAGKGRAAAPGGGGAADKSAWLAAAAAGGAPGGAKGKGKKVDASLLGFGSKTDFSVLAGQHD